MEHSIYGCLVFVTGIGKWHIDPFPDGGDDLVVLNLTDIQEQEAWERMNTYGTVTLDEAGTPQGTPWFDDGGVAAELHNIPEKKFWLGVFMKIAPDATAEREEAVLVRGREYAVLAQGFLQRQLPKEWDVDVRTFAVRSKQACGNPTFMRTDILKYVNANKADWGGWVPTHHFAWGDNLPNRCGEAILGGSWGALSTYPSCLLNVINHEAGHMLGFDHSNTKHEDGTVAEYGDGETSVMGSSRGSSHRPGFNFIQRKLLNWPLKILEVTDSQEFLLAPCTIGPESLRTDEYNGATIRGNSGKLYYLSTYKTRGIPDYVLEQYANCVFLHSWETNKKTLAYTPWITKDKSKTIDGIEIELVESADEVWRIRAKLNNLPLTKVVRLPTNTFPPPEGTAATPEHAGLWFNPKTSGQGFDIQVADDGRSVLAEFTFGKNAANRWLIGTSSNEFYHMESRYGGTLHKPGTGQVKYNCKAQASFSSLTEGLVLTHDEDNGRSSVVVQRLTPSNLPLSGVWFDQTKDGSGFLINQLPPAQGGIAERLVVFFYTFGHKSSTGYNNRWYEIQAKKTLEGSWEGSVYAVKTGVYHQPGTSNPEVAGSAKFTLKTVEGNEQLEMSATIENQPVIQTLTRLL